MERILLTSNILSQYRPVIIFSGIGRQLGTSAEFNPINQQARLLEAIMKMRTMLIALVAAGLPSISYAALAIWTGRQEQVQTVTYKWVWRCEYRYNNQTFWRLFESNCPSSIEIQ